MKVREKIVLPDTKEVTAKSNGRRSMPGSASAPFENGSRMASVTAESREQFSFVMPGLTSI